MAKTRVGVIVRYGLNPIAWRVRHAQGEVSDATPYGYHWAESHVDMEWTADRPEGRVALWWRMTVRRVLGFDFVHVWRNRGILTRADVVWTHTEREHLAVALLRTLNPRRYRARTIAQSVWLWDLWPRISWLRRAAFARLLKAHDVEVVLSALNRDDSLRGVPGRKVLRVPFGTHFAVPRSAAPAASAKVLVIGNDRHRDWHLMKAVAERVPGLSIEIISLSEDVKRLEWPANVTVNSYRQREILAEVYRTAAVVALPLTENRHASGCTVAIEAVSAGVPVVATDAGGIGEYLRDADATLVPHGDVEAFAAALEKHASAASVPDPAVAERRGMSERDYVDRLLSITASLMAGSGFDPAVETFAPVSAVEKEHSR